MQNYYQQSPYGFNQQQMYPTGGYPATMSYPQPAPQPVGGAISFSVDDPAQIRANDVPMNVEYVLFPRKDGSAVYKKFWNGQGELKTAVYVLQEDTSSTQASKPDPFAQINDRLGRIEETLASWSK